MAELRIGTSGWVYKHWRGLFYPGQLTEKEWLHYYHGRFDTVEINNAFYQLPKEATLAAWREAVPCDFRFAVKASRYITHMKKLKEPKESTRRFMEAVAVLGDKLGPLLFQLPPSFDCAPDRLREFLRELPRGHRYVFEFRDARWWNNEVYEILRRNNAAFCIYDLAGEATPVEATADFVYLRLHGPESGYQGSYNRKTLVQWARRIKKWRAEGRSVYCYFDNDQNAVAPFDAAALQTLCLQE
ncbi:MAG: DUF72 domain-containing protein [Opitutales bacterium]